MDSLNRVPFGIRVVFVAALFSVLYLTQSSSNSLRKSPSGLSFIGSNQRTGKPWFVIHLGPPKTATTTIETEMTKFFDTLQLDNYVYLGKFYPYAKYNKKRDEALSILRTTSCMKRVYDARVNGSMHRPPCWNDFLKEMNQYKGKNVLLSDEEFGFRWFNMDGGMTPLDWKTLMRDLKHWNVIAVVGYRRLVDWFPSAKQQNDRWFAGRKSKRIKFFPPKGQHLKPLFPEVLSYPQITGEDPEPPNKKLWFHYFAHDIIENLKAFDVPYRIFNMHEEGIELRSNFLCNILPNAPRSCKESLKQDAEGSNLVANQEKSFSLYYDRLATEAAERNYFRTENRVRHVVAEQFMSFHNKAMGQSIDDLPVICPSSDEANTLLEASLRMEKRIMGDRLSAHDHRVAFQKNMENRKYCWIDVEEALRDARWQRLYEYIERQNTPDLSI